MPDSPAVLPDLVGDIGGTHTRLALAQGGELRAGSAGRFVNAEYASLDDLLRYYLRGAGVARCAGACLAVAGPVHEGAVRMTNLGWAFEVASLATVAGTRRVALINDLQAQGLGLAEPRPATLRAILPGATPSPQPAARRLVLGLGTGVNTAVVHPTPAGPLVPPAESGHVHLPQPDDETRALARHLAARHSVATVEEALSGRGLAGLHAFVAGGPALATETVAAMLAAGEARATGDLYARLLGAHLADLALVHLPVGGIFLIGGLARAVVPYLPESVLDRAMRGQGRYAAMLGEIGVWLVEDDFAALSGCVVRLSMMDREGHGS